MKLKQSSDIHILSIRCSYTRSALDAEIIIKLESLGLEYKHIRFGERNSIERWFRYIKT